MAFPTIAVPYGLRPVNLIGGLPFAGATRQVPIASSYDTSLFYGDVVQYAADGTLIITTLQNDTSAVPGVVGVFMGCSYTDPALKYQLFSQYYPANTVATDIVAYVSDDPNALYKVASVTGATADGASSGLQTAFKSRANSVPANAELVLNTGLISTGNSRMGVFINNVTTALPMRVVDVVQETADSSGNYVEFIVKFNAGYHTYNAPVGV